MPSIPLPFVVALLLAVLSARMALRRGPGLASTMLVAFVAACAVQVAIGGVRWVYGSPLAALAQPILASLLPPAAWIGFAGLGRSGSLTFRSIWPHLLAPAAVVVLTFVSQQLLDPALIIAFLGYGAALLWRLRLDSDAFSAVRLGDEIYARRALLIVGACLIASGLTDLAVALDFTFAHGAHAATIISVANVLLLGAAGYAASVAQASVPVIESEAPAPRPSRAEDADDAAVLAAVDILMRDRRLYCDPNLTLDRLARRAGIPARRISTAVNRLRQRNVSQLINEYRVAAAKRRLAETDDPITAIMFDVGFQTKSNFNREFRRVTGVSPRDIRRDAVGHMAEGVTRGTQ